MVDRGDARDMEQLVENYFNLIRFVVRRSGIVAVDDTAHEVLCRFVESGAFADYDPERVHQTPSGPRRARMSTYLVAFAQKTVRGLRDRERRVESREQPLGPAAERCSDGGIRESDSRMFADWVEAELAKIPDWGRCLTCWTAAVERHPNCCADPKPAYSLVRAWRWLREDFESTGSISQAALASRMRGPACPKGLSSTAAGGVLMARLRVELIRLGAVPGALA